MSKINIVLLAGNGDLPKTAFEAMCETQKYDVSVVSIKNTNEIDENAAFFSDKVSKYLALNITQVKEFLEFIKQNQIKQIIIAGKVAKPNFTSIKTDETGKNLIAKILKFKIFSDDFILKVITKKLQKMSGAKVINLSSIVKNITATKNDQTALKPSVEEMQIIKKGFDCLKKISAVDLAQSIVVSNAGILGVEGPEGTDGLIDRCSTYYQHWCEKNKVQNGGKQIKILVKASKTRQTRKADIPVVGISTAQNIIKHNYAGIAIKKNDVIMIDKAQVIKLLNENGKFLFVE